MQRPFPYNRVCVIGVSASGKTTLATALAKKMQCDHIELDALYHDPNWVDVPRAIFRERAEARLKADRWVCDGYYANWARQFDRADLIIWLDYPFHIVLRRVLWRTFRRLVIKEELWNGNYESWKMAFSRESIILWVFQTYWKRKKEIPRMLAWFDAEKLRFRHPREARRWLEMQN
jgi:adenylate kinase family enzyme